MVVRARVPFDNLDQVGAFGVFQRVLLRPRQEMERCIVGGFADTGSGFGRVRGRSDMAREIAIDRAKKSPRDEARRLSVQAAKSAFPRVPCRRMAWARRRSPRSVFLIIAAVKAQGRLGQLSARSGLGCAAKERTRSSAVQAALGTTVASPDRLDSRPRGSSGYRNCEMRPAAAVLLPFSITHYAETLAAPMAWRQRARDYNRVL
jgi:hypothetical protein